MLIDNIKQSAEELFGFFGKESPYRSANKGWISENIYFNFKPEKVSSSKRLDEIAKASIYWNPIIQMLSVLFSVVILAILLAFSPLYLLN